MSKTSTKLWKEYQDRWEDGEKKRFEFSLKKRKAKEARVVPLTSSLDRSRLEICPLSWLRGRLYFVGALPRSEQGATAGLDVEPLND